MKPIMLTQDDVYAILPDRMNNTHKGDYGKILLLCGSLGYTGAASLAAMGALRTGAGLVYLGVPDCVYPIVASKLLEPVVFPLPDINGCIAETAIGQLSSLLPKIDAVLIGCGLGQSKDVTAVVDYVLKAHSGPIIIDADGINVLKDHKDILRGRTSPTVLTPHEGEFMRLMQLDVMTDRVTSAVEASRDLGAVIVLKGYNTVITDSETVYINPTGNPGMAVGGSGDVLAGMIVGLIGQKIPVLEAAACAVWLHGTAGDVCAREIGQYGMLPSDMLQVVSRLMK